MWHATLSHLRLVAHHLTTILAQSWSRPDPERPPPTLAVAAGWLLVPLMPLDAGDFLWALVCPSGRHRWIVLPRRKRVRQIMGEN